MSKNVNWALLSNNEDKMDALRAFASGATSGRTFYDFHKGTEGGGEVRNLLREFGIKKARQLAKKAASRRPEKDTTATKSATTNTSKASKTANTSKTSNTTAKATSTNDKSDVKIDNKPAKTEDKDKS